MKLRYTFLALCLSLIATGSAQAERSTSFRDVLRSASVPVPAEWAGVWTTVDTSYDCVTLAFKNTNTQTDTVCVGQEVGDPGTLPYNITCTGSANATTVHMHCTGSGELIPGCTVDIDIVTDGTVSGDSYYMVTTSSFTYTGAGCLGIPDQCLVLHSHGTRIASAPPAYCATPTQPSTWGGLKAHYR
ncbi:MAG TPA: hypothetical protein VGR66_10320 [Candidatus Eisenbacteria bacterium]|nr:hypothetical protein [Candidatus Eisenbacteria bacterium]